MLSSLICLRLVKTSSALLQLYNLFYHKQQLTILLLCTNKRLQMTVQNDCFFGPLLHVYLLGHMFSWNVLKSISFTALKPWLKTTKWTEREDNPCFPAALSWKSAILERRQQTGRGAIDVTSFGTRISYISSWFL